MQLLAYLQATRSGWFRSSSPLTALTCRWPPLEATVAGASPKLLAEKVHEAAGPIPEWHPDCLAVLIAKGQLSAATTAIRELLKLSEQASYRIYQIGSHLEAGA